jgi:D-cysteine desulfhydrase
VTQLAFPHCFGVATPLRIGDFPTRVTRAGELWVKDDGASGAIYGGNKVRKLEHLLGDAIARGKRRLVTLGAAGSHQVVALAMLGPREGFDVEAVLVPQPWSSHAERNLRVAVAQGLRVATASTWPTAPAVLATRLGRDAYAIPLGGSNALGSIGFVAAAEELAMQVQAGVLSEPDVIVVAMGSGGTAAGLAVGLEKLAMKTRVVGVAISPPAVMLEAMARRVAKKTAARIGLPRAAAIRAAARIETDASWIGRGYGHPTAEGDAATKHALAHGIALDPTYTAKAYACAIDRARRGATVLYWHTLSSALLPDAPVLPPELSRLLK